jgi:aspartate/methionine/tyrosine aminotransferase
VAPIGLPELREAIAADVRSRGVAVDADQVLVTPSAKTAVFYAMLATIAPGDEVLVPDPGFPIYPSMTRFAGGVPVGYGVNADNAPDVDDIYSRLVYEGGRAPTVAAFDEARDRTLLIDGFSKTYAMTGYRLGYLVAPRAWMERLTTLAINGHTCVPPFVQRAGLAALTGPQDIVQQQLAAYRARRDLLVAGLNALPGVRCPTPAGAFYVFPDFSELLARHGMTSREFARRLLEDHGVAAIDGRAFGSRGEGCLRFSFASAQADLDSAIARVREAVGALDS